MIYADTNFFVYAALGGDVGEEAAAFLSKNSADITTSFLTLDEVAWVLWRRRSATEALFFYEFLLSSGVNFLEVNATVARSALSIMREFALKPRDAFHAAAMVTSGIKTIFSEDKDFDKLPGVKRIWFRKGILPESK